MLKRMLAVALAALTMLLVITPASYAYRPIVHKALAWQTLDRLAYNALRKQQTWRRPFDNWRPAYNACRTIWEEQLAEWKYEALHYARHLQ